MQWKKLEAMPLHYIDLMPKDEPSTDKSRFFKLLGLAAPPQRFNVQLAMRRWVLAMFSARSADMICARRPRWREKRKMQILCMYQASCQT